LFQKPGELPRIALVFKSTTGCGKDMWISFIRYILGAEFIYKTSKLKDIVGDFNSAIDSKLICVANEVEPKNFKDFKENIKEHITEEQMSLVRKGQDPIIVPNYSRLIFHTNNNFGIEINDRRYAMFECSHKVKQLNLNEGYFEKMSNYIKNPVVQKLFYNYCIKIDIRHYNFELNRPKTKVFKESLRSSMPFYLQFLVDKFNDLCQSADSDWDGIIKVKKTDLLTEYNTWITDCNNVSMNEPPKRTAQKFKIEVTSTLLEKLDLYYDENEKDITVQPIIIIKIKGTEHYKFNVLALYQLFIDKNIADEIDKTTNQTLQMSDNDNFSDIDSDSSSENDIVDNSEFD